MEAGTGEAVLCGLPHKMPAKWHGSVGAGLYRMWTNGYHAYHASRVYAKKLKCLLSYRYIKKMVLE